MKLAQDIHTVVEVTEDGNCSVLKPLISASKTRKVSVSSTARAGLDRTIVDDKVKCACSNELLELKDTVCSIQADILLLKQTQHAAEKLRAEQLNCIRSVITQIS